MFFIFKINILHVNNSRRKRNPTAQNEVMSWLQCIQLEVLFSNYNGKPMFFKFESRT